MRRRARDNAATDDGVTPHWGKSLAVALCRKHGSESSTALTAPLAEVGGATIARGNFVPIHVVPIHVDETRNTTGEHALAQLPIALGDAVAHQATAPARPSIVDGRPVCDAMGGASRIRSDSNAAEAIAKVHLDEPFLFQLAGEQARHPGTGRLTIRS